MPRIDLRELMSLSPSDFERLVQRVFEDLGYEVEHVGGPGDGGIDLKVRKGDGPLRVVQCKRYSDAVGPGAVRELLGAMRSFGAEAGCLVTSGNFTMSAEQTATSLPVTLIDGPELVHIINNERMSSSQEFVERRAPLGREAGEEDDGPLSVLTDVAGLVAEFVFVVGNRGQEFESQVHTVLSGVQLATDNLSGAVIDPRLSGYRARGLRFLDACSRLLAGVATRRVLDASTAAALTRQAEEMERVVESARSALAPAIQVRYDRRAFHERSAAMLDKLATAYAEMLAWLRSTQAEGTLADARLSEQRSLVIGGLRAAQVPQGEHVMVSFDRWLAIYQARRLNLTMLNPDSISKLASRVEQRSARVLRAREVHVQGLLAAAD